jgi:hypothetical protein
VLPISKSNEKVSGAMKAVLDESVLDEVRQRPLFDTSTLADYRSKVVRERLRE